MMGICQSSRCTDHQATHHWLKMKQKLIIKSQIVHVFYGHISKLQVSQFQFLPLQRTDDVSLFEIQILWGRRGIRVQSHHFLMRYTFILSDSSFGKCQKIYFGVKLLVKLNSSTSYFNTTIFKFSVQSAVIDKQYYAVISILVSTDESSCCILPQTLNATA